MNRWSPLLPLLVVGGAMSLPVLSSSVDGPVVHARLLSRVSTSSSAPGDLVSAVSIGLPGEASPLPSGCRLSGKVVSVRRGDRVDRRPDILLAFDTVQDGSGIQRPFPLRVSGVDNAREDVAADGHITGLAPLRVRPSRKESLLMLAAYAHPVVLGAIEAARLGLRETRPVTIDFTPGVELTLVPQSPAAAPSDLRCNGPAAELMAEDQATATWVAAQPLRAQAGEPPRDGDWINLAVVGSREAVAAAFAGAQWDTAEHVSLRVDARTFLAVAEDTGYRHGPLSLLTLQGAPPAFVFQKQTNTFAKRHHVRFWPASGQPPGGGVAWVGAATHDVGVEFSHEARQYTHRIDSDLDDERRTLLTDLVTAGAVQRFMVVPRASVPAQSTNATGDTVNTDGRIAIVWLTSSGTGSTRRP